MRRLASQSAMEFLMTYGYVFLIITIVVGLLIAFFSIPKTTLPFSCSFYSGFTCTDAALWSFGNKDSLVIAAIDNMPGIVNITGFNAVIDYQKNSGGGYCIPNNGILEGQYIYCIANFTFYSSPQNIFQGTFNITSNYCTGSAQNLSLTHCKASTGLVFGGGIRVQGINATSGANTLLELLTLNPSLLHSVPITITNNQPIATPAPFQELLAFPSSTYGTYIKSNWNNVEFSTLPAGRGTVLEAWIESNPSNTGTTDVWLNLPGGIAANSSITIYADFMSGTVLSASGPTGEAPQLSSSYGQYDDGVRVFRFYDNFSGTALSSLWTGSGNVVVNNGITIAPGGSITSNSLFSPLNMMLDLYWSAVANVPAASLNFGYNSEGLPQYNGLYWKTTSAGQAGITANALGFHTIVTGLSYSGPYVFSIGTNSISAVAAVSTGGGELAASTYSTTVRTYSGFNNLQLVSAVGSGTNLVAYWIRLRSMAPNGVMPTAIYGNVVTLGVGG